MEECLEWITESGSINFFKEITKSAHKYSYIDLNPHLEHALHLGKHDLAKDILNVMMINPYKFGSYPRNWLSDRLQFNRTSAVKFIIENTEIDRFITQFYTACTIKPVLIVHRWIECMPPLTDAQLQIALDKSLRASRFDTFRYLVKFAKGIESMEKARMMGEVDIEERWLEAIKEVNEMTFISTDRYPTSLAWPRTA